MHTVEVFVHNFKSGICWIAVNYKGAKHNTHVKSTRVDQISEIVQRALDEKLTRELKAYATEYGHSWRIYLQQGADPTGMGQQLHALLNEVLVQHDHRTYKWPAVPRVHPIVQEMRDAVEELGERV